MENLRIYLLGTFRLYRDGVLLTSRDWQIRHARQLFKLLFTERGHNVPASKVIDLLWPYSAEHTHKTLRGVASILRNVLEPERASGEPSRFVPRGSLGYTLQLPGDGTVWVDSIEFERLLDETSAGHESPKRRRLLESALQLYTGDYLAEDEDESWTLTERSRLRERYFSSALSLMEAQRKLNLYNEAISVGRRALGLDVCREPFYPLIMYCQVALGDTVGALQTFEQCRQELHNRLGVDPSPQTLKLHTELLRGELHIKSVKQSSAKLLASATGVTGASGAPLSSVQHSNGVKKHTHDSPLVGCKDTIEYIVRYVDALQDKQARQRTRAIALVGEMGIGKSFLLRHVLNSAHSTHIATLVADCYALEQGVLFAPLLVMVKAWLAELGSDELTSLPNSALAVLAHLLPELQMRIPGLLPVSFLNAEQAYSSLIASFVDLFQALGQQRPCIVAVDNLQWADEASLLVLHRLARASTLHATTSQHSPLLLLLTYRPEDVQENTSLYTMLLSLSRCSYFHALHLSPFSMNEVGDYLKVHTLAHACPADQCYQATQGNAFFLAEAARLLADQKELDVGARNTSQPDFLLALLQHSTKIRDAVLARLACLPERAVELLEQAAVIGHPFPPALLGSPLSTQDYKLLDMLIARRFLIEQSVDDHELCLAFTHQLVARIIYSNCTALKRSQLHLRTAEQFVRHYADTIDLYSIEIAFHYRQAGPKYQPQTLSYEVET